jgi:O-antigen ligase
MPPALAALITIWLIVYLFRRDSRLDGNASPALWIPFWWLFFACTRAATEWLSMFGIPVPSGSLEEGSAIDRIVYIGLIIAGVRVLVRRNITLQEVARENIWLTVFLAYSLLSVCWSDYPFVSLKRWIKVVGHPIMALIVLTERDREAAVIKLIKRCAYVLIPLSILFIKYYPEWGRGFDAWSGVASNRGVGLNKNMLGLICLIIGYVVIWRLCQFPILLTAHKEPNEKLLLIGIGAANAWLLILSESKTPLVSLAVALFIVWMCGLKWVNKKMIWLYILFIGMIILSSQWIFNIYEVFLRMLGKDPTLTDRTLVWRDVLSMDFNPIFGTGFESFWLGDRLKKMWELWAFQPNQAHNGYLETYITLGAIGLALLIGLLLATFVKAQREITYNFEWGRFRLGFLFALIVFNWTEAAFKTTHPMFFMFYLITIDLAFRKQSNSMDHREINV